MIGSNSAQLASAGGAVTSGLFSRSLELTDNAARPDPGAALESARARYFDALVEVKTAAVGTAGEDAQHNLALAKTDYNDARRALGLELIE